MIDNIRELLYNKNSIIKIGGQKMKLGGERRYYAYCTYNIYSSNYNIISSNDKINVRSKNR